MNNSLHRIQRKIDNLQHGLLRFHDKNSQITLYVKAATNEDESFNCVVIENSYDKKLHNKNVNLIQKSYNDYLYIRGKVSAETSEGARVLSIRITKACWFERTRKGSVSWLKEKYVFESSVA